MGIHFLISDTKIRIPMAHIRDASHLVNDMDAHLFDERKLNSDQRIEEKIKRERAINERSGWLDCTEVFVINQFPFVTSVNSKLWGNYLGTEEDVHAIQPKDQNQRHHISTRRRIGRGGRVIFDRHCHNRSSFDTSVLDPSPSIPIQQPEYHLLTSLLSFRVFQIAPRAEQHTTLQNKPAHIQPFDPNAQPEAHIPPVVTRAPLMPPQPKKKRPVSEKALAAKKKVIEQLDPRTAAVKSMMKQAQKAAQQSQAQIQMHQAFQGPMQFLK